MIRLACQVPNKIYLAFSGGVDSLTAAHFFKQGGKSVELLHFNHGCEYSNHIEEQCISRATDLNLPIHCASINEPTAPAGKSLEDHWRTMRYRFLRPYSLPNTPVITCHHLDDAVETWIWSSLHGEGKLIPVKNNGITRPFLLTEKQELVNYATRHGLVPVDDPYNRENHLMRNYMRVNMMEHAYYINPGLRKVIRKKYLNHEN